MKRVNWLWFLFLPSALLTYVLWNVYSSMKVECLCPWNDRGERIATIVGIAVFLAQAIVVVLLARFRPRFAAVYYLLALIAALIAYVAVMSRYFEALT